jgi:hypothetical protein
MLSFFSVSSIAEAAKTKSELSFERRTTMKSNFSRILTVTAIALIAVCASAAPASAQGVFKGSFTLSEDVRWSGATLPAGDYSFVLKSAALPCQIALQGPNGGAFILTPSTDKRDDGETSRLTIERRGATRFVSDIYLADLGLHLRYQAPSLPKGERMLAQGPASTEQVLIAMAKN